MEFRWNAPKISTTKATFTWGNSEVDYSVTVHEGETYLGGRSPNRPWTEVGIAEFSFEQTFKSNYQGDLSVAFEQTMRQLSAKFDDVIDNHDWGIESNNKKQYRNAPTWRTITDSGNLRDSQTLTFE